MHPEAQSVYLQPILPHVMPMLQAVPLVELMLLCLQRTEQHVADAVLQFFTCLDFVPMAERVRGTSSRRP